MEYFCCSLLGASPFTRRGKGKGQKQIEVSSSSFPRQGFGAFYHHPWLVGFSEYFVLWLSKLYPKGRNVLSLDKDSFCYVKPEALAPLCTDLRRSTKWGLQHDLTTGTPSCFQRDPQIWEAVSPSSQNLKGSSPTSFELIYKSDLKTPRRVFTKPVVSLYAMWNSITKPRAQTFQGPKTEAGWHKKKILVQKALKAFKACCKFLHSFLSPCLTHSSDSAPCSYLVL